MNQLFSPEDDSIVQIHDQLAHLVKTVPNSIAPPQLSRARLAELIETAFWASLRSSEGRTTRFCVTVAAPESSLDAVKFVTPVCYDEPQIVKLSPAVPREGCLVVSEEEGKLMIWGFDRSRPGRVVNTVTLEVSEPGIVRVGVGPHQPFAVLKGQSNPIIAGTRISLAQYLQHVLQKPFPVDDLLERQALWWECLALADLARMIVADGHGGTVLIVPDESGVWPESLNPFPYRFTTPDTTIPDVIRQQLKHVSAHEEVLHRPSEAPAADDPKSLSSGSPLGSTWGWMERRVRAAASLAGVDGAIVMTWDLRLLGFGAHIATQDDATPQVCIFRLESGSQSPVPSPFEDLGGTRHQSAARFTAANKGSVALVISQDRHVSVMHWDEHIDAVAVVRDVEWWM